MIYTNQSSVLEQISVIPNTLPSSSYLQNIFWAMSDYSLVLDHLVRGN